MQWNLAGPVLAISAASDWLDGLAARRLNQQSVLGSYLDPIADKVLIGSVTVALAQAVSQAGGRGTESLSIPAMHSTPGPLTCTSTAH